MEYDYEVREVVKVVDGDTFDLIVDPGFRLSFAGRFRLLGWDTPELRRGSDYERERGKVATEAATAWFTEHAGDVRVLTAKADSFGRWLAAPYSPTDTLGDLLGDLGLATEWPTRWRDVYDSGTA